MDSVPKTTCIVASNSSDPMAELSFLNPNRVHGCDLLLELSKKKYRPALKVTFSQLLFPDCF